MILVQKNVKRRKWKMEHLQQLLRCCCARYFDGSQIPVTRGGFKLCYMKYSYMTL